MVSRQILEVDEYLRGVQGIGFYSAAEIAELLSFFSDEAVSGAGGRDPEACARIVLSRISAAHGAVADAVHWGTSEKIVTAAELGRRQTAEGFSISVVSGSFDLLHLGHLRGIRFAKEEFPRNKLAVLVLRDAAIQKKKGDDRPIFDTNERAAILAAVSEVDFVVPLDDPSCLSAIRILKPRAFFKSPGDSDQQIVREEQDLARSEGGRVFAFPPCSQVTSTTELVQHARDRARGPTLPEDREQGCSHGEWPLPTMLGIMLTRMCNLQCPICFTCSGATEEQHLPLDTVRKALDEARDWGVRRIRLTGGEPTLHPHFAEVLDACHDREMGVSLNTNGIYSQDTLRYLCGSSVGFFLISVDGSETTNDALRGTGMYRRAVDSIEALDRAGKHVMVSFHASVRNSQDIHALAALCMRIGVDLRVGPFRPCGRGKEHRGDVLSPSQYLALVQEIKQLRERYPQLTIHTDFDILGERRPDGHYSAGLWCKAGRELVFLSSDGGVYPCAFFTPDPSFRAGYAHEESIESLWRMSPVFAPFRSHRPIATCEACSAYEHQCPGGCRAMAYFVTGSVHAHDPTCFAHLLARSPSSTKDPQPPVESARKGTSGD